MFTAFLICRAMWRGSTSKVIKSRHYDDKWVLSAHTMAGNDGWVTKPSVLIVQTSHSTLAWSKKRREMLRVNILDAVLQCPCYIKKNCRCSDPPVTSTHDNQTADPLSPLAKWTNHSLLSPCNRTIYGFVWCVSVCVFVQTETAQQELDERCFLSAQSMLTLKVSEHFQVLKLLGEGSYGKVMLAVHRKRGWLGQVGPGGISHFWRVAVVNLYCVPTQKTPD